MSNPVPSTVLTNLTTYLTTDANTLSAALSTYVQNLISIQFDLNTLNLKNDQYFVDAGTTKTAFFTSANNITKENLVFLLNILRTTQSTVDKNTRSISVLPVS